ncbi:phage tail assembly chaperone [Aurantiacibacter marinus]|uniref:Phage tail assembly chaperone n=1 Tax=Aurantiacibacter marinus TaxID=874156 RepID=A0A0H0XSA6_9SPHN|nr:phage tail assembly chaperone [Aurantiacibacter marinus]KLI64856.1 hypothetical protein AAV99_04945 [Aurantiacibacter marinus]
MSESFAAGARRLAGIAGRLLNWPPDWFWDATPAELAAILCAEDQDTDSGMSRQTLEQMMENERDGR